MVNLPAGRAPGRRARPGGRHRLAPEQRSTAGAPALRGRNSDPLQPGVDCTSLRGPGPGSRSGSSGELARSLSRDWRGEEARFALGVGFRTVAHSVPESERRGIAGLGPPLALAHCAHNGRPALRRGTLSPCCQHDVTGDPVSLGDDVAGRSLHADQQIGSGAADGRAVGEAQAAVRSEGHQRTLPGAYKRVLVERGLADRYAAIRVRRADDNRE